MTENKEQIITEQELAGRRFAYLCYIIFNEGMGQELMGHLETILSQPVAPHKESAPYAYFREGQNDIIRRLKAGICLHTQIMRGDYDRRSSNNTNS